VRGGHAPNKFPEDAGPMKVEHITQKSGREASPERHLPDEGKGLILRSKKKKTRLSKQAAWEVDQNKAVKRHNRKIGQGVISDQKEAEEYPKQPTGRFTLNNLNRGKPCYP